MLNFLKFSIFFIALVKVQSLFAFTLTEVKSEFISDKVYPPSVHASSICEVSKGVFAATWFGGSFEKSPDTSIWFSLNTNGLWETPRELVCGIMPNSQKRYPAWNPVITKTPSGRVLLFYKVGSSPRDWFGYYIYSDDACKTWSKPVSLPEGFIGPVRSKPIYLENGDIIMPSSQEVTSRGAWSIHFEKADANLKNWSVSAPEKLYTNYFFFADGVNVIQPSIVRLKSGKIVALCRSREHFAFKTESLDDGKTWSNLERVDNLKNQNSGIDMLLLKDETILVAYNPGENRTPRRKLLIAKSSNFNDWDDVFTLEDFPPPEHAEFSYPSIIQDSEGLIHLTYTWNRTHIKHVVLKIE